MERPLLIYDGDCGFCRFWVETWKVSLGDRVDFAPSQEVASQFPQIPPEKFAEAVQLVLPDGRTFAGAEAVFRALALVPGKGWMLWLYEYLAGFALLIEWCYRIIARHRNFFLKVTRLAWGRHPGPPSYHLTRWLFVRLLGLVYFLAFLSLWIQVGGLIGADGILPARGFLGAVTKELGYARYHLVPTLAWIDPSDAFLKFLCGAGTLLAVPLVLGFAEGPLLAVLWIFYLSLVSVGQDFLEFQWDILLLEAGFLAIFFAPWRVLNPHWRGSGNSNPSLGLLWLLRWLLFRLVFLSGAVKLLSHDPTWRNLTALNYHYWTQPLPTPVAWYAAQLPGWFQKLSVVGVFVIELGAPFLMFLPRRVRFLGAALIAYLQVLIALTGNYAFFNLLTLALVVVLLDDRCLERFLPATLVARLATPPAPRRPGALREVGLTALAAVILAVSGADLLRTFGSPDSLPRPVWEAVAWFEPFHIANGYGLFAVMTTSRPEIIIEGSSDGQTWLAYEFKYKPGDVGRRPPWVEPHQPRLDWQMWFAALGSYRNNRWFVNLMVRLLEGSPPVMALLAKNPFPGQPPRYIRAVVYDYRFTTFSTRRATGDWWSRQFKGLYFPVASLKSQ